MAHDIIFGNTGRQWGRGSSCGKSSAELWDEAESARLRRPVRYMSNPAETSPPTPKDNVTFRQALVPLLVGAGVAGIVVLPFLDARRRSP